MNNPLCAGFCLPAQQIHSICAHSVVIATLHEVFIPTPVKFYL